MNPNQIYPNIPLPRRNALRYFITACILYAIYALVLLPLSNLFGSNIVFQGTMLYEIAVFLITVIELAVFCLAFANTISARYLYGARAAVRCVLLFAAATAIRYVATFFVSWRMEGLDLSDLMFELLFLVIYVLLDVTQVAIVLVVTHLLLRREDEIYSVRTRALLASQQPLSDRVLHGMTSRSIFALRGPIHIATLISGGVVLFVRVVGRIIYDVGYGAPTDTADLLWMIFYYVTDIAIAIVCCFVVRYLVVRLSLGKRNVA
ncbi:MAG: hypothetical protein IJW40_02245 [Clostridia bacterium]|nr:hypothetical protein [Clostridia bacterium]